MIMPVRPGRPGPGRVVRAAYAIAVATAVAVVALLVGLSVAPRFQPSDWFQFKPRAVKQQIQGTDAASTPGPGAPAAGADRWRAGWGPDAVVTSTPMTALARRPVAGVVATMARLVAWSSGPCGCRGPPG
jgi:hypothetical protein